MERPLTPTSRESEIYSHRFLSRKSSPPPSSSCESEIYSHQDSDDRDLDLYLGAARRPTVASLSSDDGIGPVPEVISAPSTAPMRALRDEKMNAFLPYVDKPGAVEEKVTSQPVRLAEINKEWIDLDILRGWTSACDQYHGDVCRHIQDSNMPQPVKKPYWLIDVDSFCLVKACPQMEYLALSYVWGHSKAESACALQENIDALQVPGALAGKLILMPKTVLHATHLTRLLGKNYLWVDRFCIVQNDGTGAKQVQLDAMGDIYAGAEAVIIAACGENADCGLHGIPSVSDRRYLTCE